MSLTARLAALERQRPAAEPSSVLVLTCDGGATVSVCWPLPGAGTEHLTLGAYRTRYGDTYRDRERWTILDESEPQEDRRCTP